MPSVKSWKYTQTLAGNFITIGRRIVMIDLCGFYFKSNIIPIQMATQEQEDCHN